MELESTDGYSAWISIDNVKLPKYERKVVVTAPGEKEVSCWIASEVGKKFVVKGWSFPEPLPPHPSLAMLFAASFDAFGDVARRNEVL
ncbi:hypothetical protein BD779DRAFT_1678235 [Infundibulicybe gibba]|nr:hypothetical protein BD779DRAFT_1678235 [Infundibulicybe gibba]